MPLNPADHQTDFARPVVCLLGLPFDAIDPEQAVAAVREAVRQRRRCMLSTPNVNFLVAAQKDDDFRESVLASDLSIADGMPIVWLAGMLGLPIRARVAGSDLVEALAETKGVAPIRCFLFGGQDDAAERACRRLNQSGGGLECAGALNPGVGSADDLSQPEFIAQINATTADFLIVSLGAQKGQAWIMRNAPALETPVISHLGAVVNFLAGSVRRAPVWLRRCGLEWLWRIGQEPALAWRYLRDGLALIWLVLARVIPLALLQARSGDLRRGGGSIREQSSDAESIRFQLRGALGDPNLAQLRAAFTQAVASQRRVDLDFSEVTYIDATFTGMLMLLRKHCIQQGQILVCEQLPRRVRKILRLQGADYLLDAGR